MAEISVQTCHHKPNGSPNWSSNGSSNGSPKSPLMAHITGVICIMGLPYGSPYTSFNTPPIWSPELNNGNELSLLVVV